MPLGIGPEDPEGRQLQLGRSREAAMIRPSALAFLATMALASCAAPTPPTPESSLPPRASVAPPPQKQEPRPPTPPPAAPAAQSQAPFVSPGEMDLSPSSVASTSAPSSSTESQGVSSADANLYSGRILTLKRLAENNSQGREEADRMGFLALAIKYSESAVYHLAVMECLKNQLGLGVPFYQGQATCSSAVARPSTN